VGGRLNDSLFIKKKEFHFQKIDVTFNHSIMPTQLPRAGTLLAYIFLRGILKDRTPRYFACANHEFLQQFCIEDRLDKANHNETGIRDFLPLGYHSFLETKVIGPGKVATMQSSSTITQCLIGYLGLSILEDSIAMDVPGTINHMIV
jgi:hypothetical protein